MSVEIGSIVEGKVTGIAKFGAFVSLPENKVGMVHISEVASSFVSDINEFLKEGQTVNVKVLSIGEDGKISLSIRKASETNEQQPKKQPKAKHQASAPTQSARPGDFEWAPQKTENASFEDMMLKYKQSSEEKISDIKKGFESKRGTSRSRRG